ncbi:protoheme IX farnesyltransferase [Bacillaceae bacterium SIJ1]|uniref:heme o synthase n=1 Tax=Litoribacterium kuwaitense TaxID=1398745 RepID=UPI0013EE0AB2|nr:heme o synthase [Litoribacterium kuwaitense]NGP45104.1 protoheme IX farnesyltransferase [Litoribacterium kuwaitense]
MQNSSGALDQSFIENQPWRDWISITKPGILASNLFCAFAGYGLASRLQFDDLALIFIMFGTTFVVASASMLNNFLDRVRDLKMERTRDRPLPSGRLRPRNVLIVGILTGFVGMATLYIFVNPLSAVLGFIGLFFYVVIYTAWLKPTSTWSTSIGGISGSMPPMIGYCGFSNELEPGAWLLFLFLFLWQPPHFWSLGILKKEEYRAAGYPLLPVIKGVSRTKIQMLPYVVSLFFINYLLFDYNYVGVGYLTISSILLIVWFIACLQGLFTKNEARWASSNFRLSLYFLVLSLLTMLFEIALF